MRTGSSPYTRVHVAPPDLHPWQWSAPGACTCTGPGVRGVLSSAVLDLLASVVLGSWSGAASAAAGAAAAAGAVFMVVILKVGGGRVASSMPFLRIHGNFLPAH